VVTLPSSVREGINIFLAGFVPTENLRFREESLTFKVTDNAMKELDAGAAPPALCKLLSSRRVQ
jgi:ATP-binding cassette subfamily E protein 1